MGVKRCHCVNGLKVMANIIVFDRQMDGWTDTNRKGEKIYTPNLLMRGHKKEKLQMVILKSEILLFGKGKNSLKSHREMLVLRIYSFSPTLFSNGFFLKTFKTLHCFDEGLIEQSAGNTIFFLRSWF